jgi:hypothetical protein
LTETGFLYSIKKGEYKMHTIALEEAADFAKWIINNASDTMVQRILKKYRQANTGRTDTEDKPYTPPNALICGMTNVFHETSGNNCKIQVILSENKDINFIQMELIRRNPATRLWRRVAYIRVSLHKLKKILTKALAKIQAEEVSPAPPNPTERQPLNLA